MPQFVVPQFIDVEDKIIGPITTRQFIMGVVSALLIFLAYKFADTTLFIIQAIIIFGIYVLVAFVKINGQRFHTFFLSVVRSLIRSNLRVWNKDFKLKAVKPKKEKIDEKDKPPVKVQKARAPKRSLSNLSLLVDTGGKYRPEEILKKQNAKKQTSKK